MTARRLAAGLLLALSLSAASAAPRDVPAQSNVTLRVMAANLTGNSQKYEANGVRILQGLKPDVVAIQEFNYGNNTAAEIRQFVNTALGTNFSFFRESGYSIPNGVISRHPIRAAGSWDDVLIPDRGFAWAQLDVPGTNDLFVVSVHFKAGSSSGEATTRSNQANAVKQLIASNFPANAWVVVAGDLNLQTRGESALNVLKTFLSDAPIPTDAVSGGDPDTNEPRSKPYDLVLPSFSFVTNFVPARVGSQQFPNGLVFDSRVFTPLTDVAPVQFDDSGLAQHMAVLKDFRIHYTATNRVEVPPPTLVLMRTNAIRWNAVAGVTYTVERSATLTNWSEAAQITANSTNAVFTNVLSGDAYRFYRVRF